MPHVLAYAVTDQCRPNVLAIPDFIYGGWPEVGIESYATTTAAITEAGKKPPRMTGFSGSAMPEWTSHACGFWNWAQHAEDMAFIGMNWQTHDAASPSRLAANHYVSLPEHAAYSMLLDIRGAGYSGRLKLLMHANRPVFLVERRFREFFYAQSASLRTLHAGQSDLSISSNR